MDHYLAQQWNLDVDNMPASMPDKFEKAQKMFINYSRRGFGSQTVKGATKQTLAKKLKQWARGEAENKMIDLELLYL